MRIVEMKRFTTPKLPPPPIHNSAYKHNPTTIPLIKCQTSEHITITRRTALSVSTLSIIPLFLHPPSSIASENTNTKFSDLEDSGGVKALELRIGNGPSPIAGDEVAIHYYGRLAAKQGWRFDSTYDHKDNSGEPIPFVFTLGSGKVIPGIETAVKTMKVGGLRRVVIPPSQGYQSATQEPIPPNFFDRQRLFTTIFNPTRLANGEGSTLGGVKVLELRIGNGPSPIAGDEVAIHYYGRLAAKQGWRFDSTYDHKDNSGEPIPFIFTFGSGKVISGIETAVKTMKVGGLRRVVIPPSQGYQSTTQEPIPPNFFDRQRLFTTIFNPTRLANGEGSTLGTLVFDIELIRLTHS